MPQGSKLLIPTVLYLARDSQEQLQAGGWHKGLARRHTSRSSATLLRGGTWENLGRTLGRTCACARARGKSQPEAVVSMELSGSGGEDCLHCCIGLKHAAPSAGEPSEGAGAQCRGPGGSWARRRCGL